LPGVVSDMRRRSLIYTLMTLVAALCRVGLSLEGPGVVNPVGSGIVPPTAYKSGLMPSANPIDTSGNLVVTGNVAGGMHFRGVVPYSGATNFSAPASSLAHTSGGIDSFLRGTAGSQDFEQRGGITPYYSPTWTVTTTVPGGRVVGGPGSPLGDGLRQGVALPREQKGYYQRVRQVVNRPLSRGQQELEKLIEADIARYPLGGEPRQDVQLQRFDRLTAPSEVEGEQFWQQLRVPMKTVTRDSGPVTRVTPERDTLRRSDESRATTTEPNVAMLLARGLTKPAEVRTRLDSASSRGRTDPSRLGVEPRQDDGRFDRLTAPSKVEGERFDGLTAPSQVEGLDIFEQMKMQLVQGMEPNSPAGATDVSTPERDGQAQIGAGGILDTYESFAAYSNDKFNRHIRAAESYMKQGRFYRAADAYTLATIYKPQDPLGYGGKSIALFATGEYMSSSLFLARALEVFPEYAKFRIDLVGIIGDKDTVENRILEAREWLDISKSAELEFLLSYVYYQMGRLEFARIAIESAAKKMPDSPVVAAMKKAIDERD